MKIYISYFYQIRFFKPYMIPLSTAKWDPFWYHKDHHQFVDKNGVLNGLRADPFVLDEKYWQQMVNNHQECTSECILKKSSNPCCAFMKNYKEYLNSLDFNNILARIEKIGYAAQEKLGFSEDPVIILLVHEPASCKCAERPVIQEWFQDHGIEVLEWQNK